MYYDKTYLELITFNSFEERFKYLKLTGTVGETTFGFERYINQLLYKSDEWKQIRDRVITRDNGCDLGIDGYYIPKGHILIHHINPITVEDIRLRKPKVFDMNNLISTTLSTHNAIHYGDESFLLGKTFAIRKPNDTCPWKN